MSRLRIRRIGAAVVMVALGVESSSPVLAKAARARESAHAVAVRPHRLLFAEMLGTTVIVDKETPDSRPAVRQPAALRPGCRMQTEAYVDGAGYTRQTAREICY